MHTIMMMSLYHIDRYYLHPLGIMVNYLCKDIDGFKFGSLVCTELPYACMQVVNFKSGGQWS